MARWVALAALICGALLYLTRESDPAVVGWLDRVGFAPLAELARAARHAVHAHVHLPAWFRGSASDAAFGLALGASRSTTASPTRARRKERSGAPP